jgi:hypothetical protein
MQVSISKICWTVPPSMQATARKKGTAEASDLFSQGRRLEMGKPPPHAEQQALNDTSSASTLEALA